MSKKQFWICLSLANLGIVALLGFTLRSKILFRLPFIEHEYWVGAHSHFAFGGWVTLSLLTLFTYQLVPASKRNRPWYQWMLWGIELSSVGMLFTFPFRGYALFSIIFSTLFIVFTYGYSVSFIRDIAGYYKRPAYLLSLCATISLIISSAGPFTLAYILASGSGDAILYRGSIYFYLHFQYNGFFTLSVFALLFYAALKTKETLSLPSGAKWFANLLCASIIPSFFLSLLWHPDNKLFKIFAIIGVLLIIATLACLFSLRNKFTVNRVCRSPFARALLLLALLSFIIKSLLQMGTIFPDLGNAVFGLRPIIIGFLHLVFLGLVTFYILSNYIEAGMFAMRLGFVRLAILVFTVAVIAQEIVLMIQGTGLILGNANPIYNWLLWVIGFFLFAGANLIFIAGLISLRRSNEIK